MCICWYLSSIRSSRRFSIRFFMVYLIKINLILSLWITHRLRPLFVPFLLLDKTKMLLPKSLLSTYYATPGFKDKWLQILLFGFSFLFLMLEVFLLFFNFSRLDNLLVYLKTLSSFLDFLFALLNLPLVNFWFSLTVLVHQPFLHSSLEASLCSSIFVVS